MRQITAILALLLCLGPGPSLGAPWPPMDPDKLKLRSQSVLVVDADGTTVYRKAADRVMPIASITKLMTAIVVLDAGLPLLTIALMASENRAAAALGRSTFPGGSDAFVQAMNRKARQLGMENTRFMDATGLDAGNVSTAEDLVKLLQAAARYPLIRNATTARSTDVRPYSKRGALRYVNTNRLLKNKNWDIGLSKTGYINEAGRCLVMQATLYGRRLNIVLLNSFGKLTPFGDSNRLRNYLGKYLEKDGNA